MYGCKIFACEKTPCLWKTSLIIKKFLEDFVYQGKGLPVVNLLDHRKMFAYWKLPWSNKILCLWKTTLIMEKPLLVENFLNRGKICASANFLDHGNFCACGKLPWSSKNLWKWKTSLIMEKFLLLDKFIDHREISASEALPWLWKNVFFWKRFLIVEKFLDQVFWEWSYLGNEVLMLRPWWCTFINLKQKLNSLTFLLTVKE